MGISMMRVNSRSVTTCVIPTYLHLIKVEAVVSVVMIVVAVLVLVQTSASWFNWLYNSWYNWWKQI